MDELVDVGCGMLPCYYVQRDDDVLVSSSVVRLVGELGSFERNENFEVPSYIENLSNRGDKERRSTLERLLLKLPTSVTDAVPHWAEQRLRKTPLLADNPVELWYPEWDTIDRRVNRLRPFERVTPSTRSRTFDPTYSLDDPEELIERTVDHLTRYVHEMEAAHPDHHHVVLVGGKDSQLITLIPKRTDRWHVFSADPNFEYVKAFVEANDLAIDRLFRHDNQNEETVADLREKLRCSDLMSDPRHLRWYVRLREIAAEFDGKCVFWAGTEADTINSYFPAFHEAPNYFEGHLERAASWQAIEHQTTRNFTGVNRLSPYHSPAIWEAVYRHYDPSMLSPGDDLRPEIGRRLHGSPVEWPDANPGPDPYEYDTFDVDAFELYLETFHQSTR